MPKRKLRQCHNVSDDEIESQRPVKQVKEQNSSIIGNENIVSTSKEKQNSSITGNENIVSTSKEKQNSSTTGNKRRSTTSKEKQNSSTTGNFNMMSSTRVKRNCSIVRMENKPSTIDDDSMDSVIASSPENSQDSNTEKTGTHYESFASFMNAISIEIDDDDDEEEEEEKKVGEEEEKKMGEEKEEEKMGEEEEKMEEEEEDKTLNGSAQKQKANTEVACPSSSSITNLLEADIRIMPVPSALSEVVVLEYPSSVTFHGYVRVTVCFGEVCIFGYELKERKKIKVLSTEGTGLKKAVPVKSWTKGSYVYLTSQLLKLTSNESDIDVDEFVRSIKPTSAVLIVRRLILPPSLRFLELYYPNAVQTQWPRNRKKETLELCSTQDSYVIDISDEFEKISEEINQIITEAVSDEEKPGPLILVRGEKNLGKSTLIRYLMNSTLNKHPVFYFLDTDLGQTEYTPPGVVSLIRVTKPLLGPPFAHQEKPLKMIFVGSLSPAASPSLYKKSIMCLMKYFKEHFPREVLFVNTMGWCQGLGELCLQSLRDVVKPTVQVEIVSPDHTPALEKKVENGVTYFTVSSKAPPSQSGVSSFSGKEMRNFNLVAYLGQCHKPYMPISRIITFDRVCVSWDKIALYVMWKKVPPNRLVEAIHCSIVALCRADPSFILKSENPELPMTLSDEPVCQCLGFGLVIASDETNRLFYVVTPLPLHELKNVNALIKGDVMIPEELILKQDIKNVALPFTYSSKNAKILGLKVIPKRAFRNAVTPVKK
ncbi:polynucleotide 5'-hydroxyl-kinase nol9-like [Argiope bruennichi]|uniref:Polynucleotide 5'-hydroxyl-kinase NOL9 n=1 Tax=Argiope bruennichi TaxID=94029 RepID=A0A8T0EZU7_ARGBR|nr:polynucleotide 5'-hydroxyl-kinase nol9-like [Argiope bruennichi]XP_055932311.1 polynucleotide 5'-hydroxyl-kinase nol9-like [Argiope bruennichi]KAF8783194.1 Polynucleotide 5'-hydroxyl-kinase NOL9 like protein [Argiope bruennichi]